MMGTEHNRRAPCVSSPELDIVLVIDPARFDSTAFPPPECPSEWRGLLTGGGHVVTS